MTSNISKLWEVREKEWLNKFNDSNQYMVREEELEKCIRSHMEKVIEFNSQQEKIGRRLVKFDIKFSPCVVIREEEIGYNELIYDIKYKHKYLNDKRQ